jgi:hypothetical protein
MDSFFQASRANYYKGKTKGVHDHFSMREMGRTGTGPVGRQIGENFDLLASSSRPALRAMLCAFQFALGKSVHGSAARRDELQGCARLFFIGAPPVNNAGMAACNSLNTASSVNDVHEPRLITLMVPSPSM